jgi:replication-associated recombination protein RarA
MGYELKTKRGYDFGNVTSAMQKAIRRNDPKTAGYFALELFHSNFSTYVWKRLLTISAEDCAGIITTEIWNLYESFCLINKGTKEEKGRIFISKAVLILCASLKNRDADHLQNLVYDANTIPQAEIEKLLNDPSDNKPIPEYAYDCHTRTGRIKGLKKSDFFQSEFEALEPRQAGLFDNLIPNLK